MTTILTVNTTLDQNDGNANNGLSLRDAIIIANANPDIEYEIQLTGGLTYNLTANGINENNSSTGDLDIKSRNNVLYIVSIGTQKATINASNLLNSDRVFEVLSGGRLSLQNVIVTGGKSGSDGGGIRVNSNSYLDLYNTNISNNESSGSSSYGGGILNAGILDIRNGSTISNNKAGFIGGGIYNQGQLTVIDSTISNNDSGGSGGGIYNSRTLTLINTTVNDNKASTGGGLSNEFSNGSAALVNTTVSGNSASWGVLVV